MSYSYVATSQPSTAVTLSATGAFIGPPPTRNLILARGSRLEVMAVSSTDGGESEAGQLVALFETPLHGRIATLDLVHPRVRGRGRDARARARTGAAQDARSFLRAPTLLPLPR